jgi:hypothetical protein
MYVSACKANRPAGKEESEAFVGSYTPRQGIIVDMVTGWVHRHLNARSSESSTAPLKVQQLSFLLFYCSREKKINCGCVIMVKT